MKSPDNITAAELREILKDAHVASLAATVAQITGDLSVLDLVKRPHFEMLGGDPQGGLSLEEQEVVREQALPILLDYFAGRIEAVPAPTGQALTELVNYIAGSDVPEQYMPFLLEELRISGKDERSTASLAPLFEEKRADMRVAIIGAGMSGLLAAYRLREASVAFDIFEKNPQVGGTWYENTYPGCRVDAQNHLYSYSFEPNYEFPNHFSTQEELFDYFRRFAERHDLTRHVRFETEVTMAEYDEERCDWEVSTRAADGTINVGRYDVVISAVGQLNRPAYPKIDGIGSFSGDAFHSATWNHDVDLTNKRVGVIGTGASAIQFVPEIASKTGKLEVFQRSAPWTVPTPDYYDVVPDGVKWLLAHVPAYGLWYRFWLFWMLTDGLYESVKQDPDWDGPLDTLSEANMAVRDMLTEAMRAQIPDDPELLEKVIPNFYFGGKRSLRDNGGWLSTLSRDDVDLVTDGIREITPKGIVTEDGVEHELDVIIYGTGFQANRYLVPMTIKGRAGEDLHEKWKDDPTAYLGVAIPGFPNFFCLYGPNTNIVVNGSIIFFSECGVRFIMKCIETMVAKNAASVEVHSEALERFREDVDAANAQMAWGRPGVENWYRSGSGRVTQNWPFPLVEYWQRTLAPVETDFLWMKCSKRTTGLEAAK